MNEHQLGHRIGQILDRSSPLDADTAARLRAARERALARQRSNQPGALLAWADNLTGRRGPDSLLWRVLVPSVVLILGLLAVHSWRQSEVVAEIEEIDAAVLTGDLPLDAYLDKGFAAWLKRSSE